MTQIRPQNFSLNSHKTLMTFFFFSDMSPRSKREEGKYNIDGHGPKFKVFIKYKSLNEYKRRF